MKNVERNLSALNFDLSASATFTKYLSASKYAYLSNTRHVTHFHIYARFSTFIFHISLMIYLTLPLSRNNLNDSIRLGSSLASYLHFKTPRWSRLSHSAYVCRIDARACDSCQIYLYICVLGYIQWWCTCKSTRDDGAAEFCTRQSVRGGMRYRTPLCEKPLRLVWKQFAYCVTPLRLHVDNMRAAKNNWKYALAR